MPSRRTYSQEAIDSIARRFDAAPTIAGPATYSTFALVQKLLPKIQAMTRNGYTWETIARMMAEENVNLSPNVLRKYVAQTQDKKRTKKRTPSGQVAAAAKALPIPDLSSTPRQAAAASSLRELAAPDDDWGDVEPVLVEEQDHSPASVPPPARSPGMAPRSPADPTKLTSMVTAGAKRSPSFVVRSDIEEI